MTEHRKTLIEVALPLEAINGGFGQGKVHPPRPPLHFSPLVGQAASDRVPVLVFDEIDADIGGRMGETVGRKLAALSAHHQVVLVTHLPQIAAFAEKQFTLTKAGKGARTVTEVHALSREARLAELAEMLRGPEKSGEAMDQAEKMLGAAEAAAR